MRHRKSTAVFFPEFQLCVHMRVRTLQVVLEKCFTKSTACRVFDSEGNNVICRYHPTLSNKYWVKSTEVEYRELKYFKSFQMGVRHWALEKLLTWSGQIIWRKDMFKPLNLHHEGFHAWVNMALSSIKQDREFQKAKSSKCKNTLPTFGRKLSSPTESRFLRVSTITSLYKVLWAGSRHSHSSGENSMATSLRVNCALSLKQKTLNQGNMSRVLTCI